MVTNSLKIDQSQVFNYLIKTAMFSTIITPPI